MSCDRVLQTQAYFDGELDAAAALEVEKHLETCADCAVVLEQADSVRHLVREKASYHRASEALRARVTRALGRASRALRLGIVACGRAQSGARRRPRWPRRWRSS